MSITWYPEKGKVLFGGTLRQPTSRKYLIAKNEIAAHIIENFDTDVTMAKLETWQEFDLYDWLEDWGFAWDGNEWARVGNNDN